MMIEEALHPHGPIGEICAGCGKEIGMLEGSYYRKSPGDDIGKTFHTFCGDPFGITAKMREAFRAGFWAWCGPANAVEMERYIKDEEAAWAEWSTAVATGNEGKP